MIGGILVGHGDRADGLAPSRGLDLVARLDGVEAAALEEGKQVADQAADGAELAAKAMAFAQQPSGGLATPVADGRKFDGDQAEELEMVGHPIGKPGGRQPRAGQSARRPQGREPGAPAREAERRYGRRWSGSGCWPSNPNSVGIGLVISESP